MRPIAGPPAPGRRSRVAVLLVGVLAVLAGLAGAGPASPAGAPQVSGSGTVITDVVPAGTPDATGVEPIEPGERMLVRGLTNRRPDRNVITVQVISGPSWRSFGYVDVRRWGSDGVWTGVLDVPPDARPGTYVVSADDGDSGDRRAFEIVSPDDTTAGTDAPETTRTPDSPSPIVSTVPPGETATGETTPGDETSPGRGLGEVEVLAAFALLALVAILFVLFGRWR